ncbi:hypothetical protein FLJC2902T_14180 [Flavobacterium limnosediminis JC2902]|uniref:Uncharacterized protein n=1 Tax=Flavobacterium limnosediminis JC2902 TaxID=1341181 RepID=V6SQB7_9FLAO|nr:hypothetical protein FLJC2902T_14180 [Flavobacterium limnosediminis JC2902]
MYPGQTDFLYVLTGLWLFIEIKWHFTEHSLSKENRYGIQF